MKSIHISIIREAYRSLIRAKTCDADLVVTQFENFFTAVDDVHVLYAAISEMGEKGPHATHWASTVFFAVFLLEQPAVVQARAQTIFK